MATFKGKIAPQTQTELYGRVVGLDGDPAEITSDQATRMAEAFAMMTWTIGADSTKTSKLFGALLWSRLLLVDVLMPYDTHTSSHLALVLKPRSLWLYYKTSSIITDFIGNQVDPEVIGTEGHAEIVTVNPPYRIGDMIRLAVLPMPLYVKYFADGYTRTYDAGMSLETYNGNMVTGIRNWLLPEPGLTAVGILGSVYNTVFGDSIYSDFYLPSDSIGQQVVYYDKNVDARTRIVGTGSDDTGTIDVPICVGGVTSVWRVKGQRIL